MASLTYGGPSNPEIQQQILGSNGQVDSIAGAHLVPTYADIAEQVVEPLIRKAKEEGAEEVNFQLFPAIDADHSDGDQTDYGALEAAIALETKYADPNDGVKVGVIPVPQLSSADMEALANSPLGKSLAEQANDLNRAATQKSLENSRAVATIRGRLLASATAGSAGLALYFGAAKIPDHLSPAQWLAAQSVVAIFCGIMLSRQLGLEVAFINNYLDKWDNPVFKFYEDYLRARGLNEKADRVKTFRNKTANFFVAEMPKVVGLVIGYLAIATVVKMSTFLTAVPMSLDELQLLMNFVLATAICGGVNEMLWMTVNGLVHRTHLARITRASKARGRIPAEDPEAIDEMARVIAESSTIRARRVSVSSTAIQLSPLNGVIFFLAGIPVLENLIIKDALLLASASVAALGWGYYKFVSNPGDQTLPPKTEKKTWAGYQLVQRVSSVLAGVTFRPIEKLADVSAPALHSIAEPIVKWTTKKVAQLGEGCHNAFKNGGFFSIGGG